MLCEVAPSSFLITWLTLTVLGFSIMMFMSGVIFYYYYYAPNVTYEKWVMKTNPKFPTPEKVRDEIVQTFKGIYTATLCPAITMWLASKGYSKGYCGNPMAEENGGLLAFVGSFLIIVLLSDLWETMYHRLGHQFKCFWAVHKHHHVFFNPSPFAVIADEYVDQFFRACPLLLFPLIMPVNMDVMFFTYGAFFYGYGVYLHWGYESKYLSAHQPYLNTAYHHYCHHSKAIVGKPYHCGFFLKIWDDLMPGGVYPVERCFCVECAQKKGLRSRKHFEAVEVPDYSILLKPSFFLQNLSGTSASDKNEALTEEEEFFAAKKEENKAA